MSQYSTGTVAVTSGSAVVTGTLTTWGGGTVKAGDYFYLPGVVSRWQVQSVASNTSLTLTTPITGVATGSGKQYVIVRDFTAFRRYPLMKKGDVETAQIFSDAVSLIDAEFQAKATGLVTTQIEVPAASTAYPLILRTPQALTITRVSAICRTGTVGFSLRVAGANATGYTSLAANQTLLVRDGTAPAGQNTTVDFLTVGGAMTATGLTVQLDYRYV